MTVEQIKTRIEEIRHLAQADPENGHAERDELYRDVLMHIAKGNEQGRGYADDWELARAALECEKVEWRWFAFA